MVSRARRNAPGQRGRELSATTWLLDGSIYFFRGYFGMPEALVDDTGQFIGGIHGFAGALAQVLLRHAAAPGAVAFDESLGSCFRNTLYPDYKANRAPPDDNIIYQFQQCYRLCELLGVACYADQRFEADDLLATLAQRTRSESIIYSKDKDLRQLVNSKCSLRDVLTEGGYSLERFREEYRFEPALFPDYQALVGDTSDNVPGVAGFGPKTAQKLIARYGPLEQVAAALPHWTTDKVGVPSVGRLADNLQAGYDQALAMRIVLRLARRAPLPPRATRRRAPQLPQLAQFLQAKRLRRVSTVLRSAGLKLDPPGA